MLPQIFSISVSAMFKSWTRFNTIVTSIVVRILALQSSVASAKTTIVLTNDDGWAVANIRAQFDALTNAGFNVSVYTDLKSGKSRFVLFRSYYHRLL